MARHHPGADPGLFTFQAFSSFLARKSWTRCDAGGKERPAPSPHFLATETQGSVSTPEGLLLNTSTLPVAANLLQPATLSIPRFEIDWPSACAPYVEQLERNMIDWAESHGLFLTENHRRRVLRTRYAWLAARCYPRAERQLLQTIANYFVWYFLADDMFVDRVDVMSPRTLPQLTAMLDVLDFNRLGEDPVYGEAAWLDICQNLRQLLPAEHFQRYANGMRLWATTAGLQILNHLSEQPAGLNTYMAIRRHTSGMNPCLDLSDSANAGPLPATEYYRPDVQQLRLHANNIVCWANDVQSLGIEMKQPGQFWSMVAVEALHHGSLQAGVDHTAARVRAEIDQFVRLANTVEQHAGHLLRGFIIGMKDWVRGYLDWVAQDTQRYDSAFAEQDADDRQLLPSSPGAEPECYSATPA
jgi:hypothetical protein